MQLKMIQCFQKELRAIYSSATFLGALPNVFFFLLTAAVLEFTARLL